MYPSVYNPPYTSGVHARTVTLRACTHLGTTVRQAACALLDLRAVGLGGFWNTFFLARNRNVTARLDLPPGKTTCVCQAKSLFCARSQFYSGTVKELLPQMSSFSDILSKLFNQCFKSVSQNEKSVKSAF